MKLLLAAGVPPGHCIHSVTVPIGNDTHNDKEPALRRVLTSNAVLSGWLGQPWGTTCTRSCACACRSRRHGRAGCSGSTGDWSSSSTRGRCVRNRGAWRRRHRQQPLGDLLVRGRRHADAHTIDGFEGSWGTQGVPLGTGQAYMVERPEPKSDEMGSSGSDRTMSIMHDWHLEQRWVLMTTGTPAMHGRG